MDYMKNCLQLEKNGKNWYNIVWNWRDRMFISYQYARVTMKIPGSNNFMAP